MSGPDPHLAARKLIDEVVDSFEKLEIVVYVYKSKYAIVPPSEIAKAISMPVDEVEKCVDSLRRERVLDPKGPWADLVAALVQVYEDDRLEILNYMTKTALQRVRKEAARVFADAFVIKPRKKGDPDG